ncbi:MAG TPA: hypothetical protein VMP86_04645 [Candidatus Binatia bacterium]|nr:hypothetical protein [Candidatus Binatia bacterium]
MLRIRERPLDEVRGVVIGVLHRARRAAGQPLDARPGGGRRRVVPLPPAAGGGPPSDGVDGAAATLDAERDAAAGGGDAGAVDGIGQRRIDPRLVGDEAWPPGGTTGAPADQAARPLIVAPLALT